MAIMAVVIFHYDARLLPGGFIGVDVFLVISGYLITSTLIKQKGSSQNFLKSVCNFYFNRVKRIVPAYYFLLTIVSIAAAILFIPTDFSYFKESLEKSIYFASNTYFAKFGDYFAPVTSESPLLHTWALAVEMQFYLLIPFIVFFASATLLRRIIPLVVVIIVLYTEYTIRVAGSEQSTYYSLYARIPDFLIGAWLSLDKFGIQWSERRANYVASVGIILILLSAVYISAESTFPGLLSLIPCLGTAMVLCSSKGRLTKLLSLPLLVWLGGLSYSLYLCHWPVLAFLRYYRGTNPLDIYSTIIFIFSTVLLSLFLHYYIEKVYRRKEKTVKFSLILTCVLAILMISMAPASVALNRILVDPLPAELTQYADQDEICHGKIVENCIRGKKRDDTDILVLGDSHGAMLNYFFDVLGKELGVTARVITGSSCVTIPGFDYERIATWAQEPCRQQITVVKNYLDKASIIILAAKWSYHVQSADFLNILTHFLEERTSANQKVVIFPQITEFKDNPVRAHRFHLMGLPMSVSKDGNYLVANSQISKIANRYHGVEFLELNKLSLFDAAPLYKGELIYRDENHLNELGAKIYGKQAVKYFQTLLTERN